MRRCIRDSDDARIVLAMTFKMGGFTIRVDWVMLIGREPFETCDLGSAPLATKVWMGFGLFLFSKLNRKSKFADLAVTKNLSNSETLQVKYKIAILDLSFCLENPKIQSQSPLKSFFSDDTELLKLPHYRISQTIAQSTRLNE